MANIMTKRGTQDNVVTYEHMCDSHDDLANIPQNQITLGSIAIVLKDNDNQIGVYMADSNKEWLSLLTMSGNSSSGAPSMVDLLHVLTANEYDAVTHIPTIAYPETNIVYLVPSANQDNNNLFDEWIYTGSNWERFGGASVSANIQPDWNQNDENAADYIKNRICYTGDPIEETLVDEICEKQKVEAEGPFPFDGFQIIYTSESPISFEYNENDIFEFSYAGKVYYKGVLQSIFSVFQSRIPATDEEEPPENYGIDLSDNSFHIFSARSSTYNQWPDSGRLVVKHISQHIEKLNPKYLPFNIRAGNDEGIVEGDIVNNIASGFFSHVQGLYTEASGQGSHAQGGGNIASGNYSHAQGHNNTASDSNSHAQGAENIASNSNSHVQGNYNEASGICSHAQGSHTKASGMYSHAQGNNTVANHRSQHVFGQYNINDSNSTLSDSRGNYVEIVGNGTSKNARSNARTLDWDGNEWLAGTLTTNINGIKIGNTTLNETQLQALLSLSLEITNPSNNDVLTYDSASAKWINKTATSGGSGGMFVANVVHGENNTHLDKTVEEIMTAINTGKTVYIKYDDSYDDPNEGHTSHYYIMLNDYTYHNDTGSQADPQTYWEFRFAGTAYTGYSLTDYPTSGGFA